MTSKKSPRNSRRAKLPRAFDLTEDFRRDWDRLNRTGRFDMSRLKEVMLLLIANGEPLGAEWLDHPLQGDWANHRECHVGGDFLLIYRIGADSVVFVRTGSHSELFR